MFNIAATGLVITALLAYLNHRFVGLPTTIGVMAAALAFFLALVGLDAVGLACGLRQYEESLLRSIDFSDVLMQGMLSLLLFAGALHVDTSELKAYRWTVGILAVLGTLLSTRVAGYGDVVSSEGASEPRPGARRRNVESAGGRGRQRRQQGPSSFRHGSRRQTSERRSRFSAER